MSFLGKAFTYLTDSGICEYCQRHPKQPGHPFCSRTCAQAAQDAEVRARQQALLDSFSGSRGSGGGGRGGGGKGGKDRGMCEECKKNPKYEERDAFGRVTVHPFCGRTCKNARAQRESAEAAAAQANNRSMWPFGSKQAPAAAGAPPGPGGTSTVTLLSPKSPVAKSVSQRFLKRWQTFKMDPPTPNAPPQAAPPGSKPSIHAVYRIVVPAKYITRFDAAMELANEGCTIFTSYYGGQSVCDIGANKEEAGQVCEFKGCSICQAIKYAFELVEFDKEGYDGVYDNGIYTNGNPAWAHRYTVAKSTTEFRAVIQCRVVRAKKQSQDKDLNVILDESGRCFSQADTIIPTHLIVYSLRE